MSKKHNNGSRQKPVRNLSSNPTKSISGLFGRISAASGDGDPRDESQAINSSTGFSNTAIQRWIYRATVATAICTPCSLVVAVVAVCWPNAVPPQAKIEAALNVPVSLESARRTRFEPTSYRTVARPENLQIRPCSHEVVLGEDSRPQLRCRYELSRDTICAALPGNLNLVLQFQNGRQNDIQVSNLVEVSPEDANHLKPLAAIDISQSLPVSSRIIDISGAESDGTYFLVLIFRTRESQDPTVESSLLSRVVSSGELVLVVPGLTEVR